MAGTIEGGKAAAALNKKKYGADFYAVIGAKGGARGRTGGFYKDREMARAAGALGGSFSRQGRKLTPAEKAKIRRKKHVQDAYSHLLAVQERARYRASRVR